jgi:hypothetical protein
MPCNLQVPILPQYLQGYEKEREDENIRLNHHRRCRRIRHVYVVEVDPGYGALRKDRRHVKYVVGGASSRRSPSSGALASTSSASMRAMSSW